MLKAQDIMSNKLVLAVPQQTLKGAYGLMTECMVRHLPVVDGSKDIVGIISRSDILLRSHRWKNKLFIPDLTVSEAMVKDVVVCSPSTHLCDVAATMMACKINSIPVVSGKTIVGIITSTDFLYLYYFESGLIAPRKDDSFLSDLELPQGKIA